MTADHIETASGPRGLTPYQGLAKWAGIGLETVVRAAEQGRLAELIETRKLILPINGRKALKSLEERKYAPGDRPLSAAQAIGRLRAARLIWEVEETELRRRRDPHRALTDLYAQRRDW